MKDKRKKSQTCITIKQNGERCKALAGKDGYCAVHSGSVPRLNTKIDPDQGVVHIKKYLVRLMLDTRQGKIKPQTTNAIANLIDKLLKCHELIETEVKIEEIMKALNEIKENNTYPAELSDLRALESEYEDK